MATTPNIICRRDTKWWQSKQTRFSWSAEGAEPYCLKYLQPTSLPEYVSVEAEDFEYLVLLWHLGYRQFKIVDPMRHNSRFPDFGNDNMFSRAAKRACWYADRFKNRFSRGPFA